MSPSAQCGPTSATARRRCLSTLDVDHHSAVNFAAGDTITVDASCEYDLSDILYLPVGDRARRHHRPLAVLRGRRPEPEPGMRRCDDGSITPLVPILVLAFLMLGGLVIDGSRDLNARSDAQAYAEEAARAGAGAVDLTSDVLALDRTRCREQREELLRHRDVPEQPGAVVPARHHQGPGRHHRPRPRATASPRRSWSTPSSPSRSGRPCSASSGFQDLSSTVHAKARPYQGLTAADAC